MYNGHNRAGARGVTDKQREVLDAALALEAAGQSVTLGAIAARLGIDRDKVYDRMTRLETRGLWKPAWERPRKTWHAVPVRPSRAASVPVADPWAMCQDSPRETCRLYVRQHRAMLRRWGWHAEARRLSGRS